MVENAHLNPNNGWDTGEGSLKPWLRGECESFSLYYHIPTHRLYTCLHAHTCIKEDKHAYIHPSMLTCIPTGQWFWEVQAFLTNKKGMCSNGPCISKSPPILGKVWLRYCYPMKSLMTFRIRAHWWGSMILFYWKKNFLAMYWPPLLRNYFGSSDVLDSCTVWKYKQ